MNAVIRELPHSQIRVVGQGFTDHPRHIKATFEAWEPTVFHGDCYDHATTRMFDDSDLPWGRCGTEHLPPEVAALRMHGKEREEAASTFRAACLGRAYSLIVEAFPEASEGARTYGAIDIHEARRAS